MKKKELLTFGILAVLLAALGYPFVSYGYGFSVLILFGTLVLVFLFRLAWVYRKRFAWARWMLGILCVCTGVGLAAAVWTGCLIAQAGFGDLKTECSYVVVLGAGVNGTTPSLSLRERLDAAYDYLEAHPEAVCVVSGGQGGGEDITEAECMYRDLTARGISPDRVWKEEQATNTRENLALSLALIQERTGEAPDHIGLVSSEYHLYRAEQFARELGITASGIPATTSWISLRVNYFLREIAAVWFYTLFGRGN